jgi:hypothetical protein
MEQFKQKTVDAASAPGYPEGTEAMAGLSPLMDYIYSVPEQTITEEPGNRTMKAYFSEIAAGEPSQVVKDEELITAATFGDIDELRRLLGNGANVRASGNSPLQLAAGNGHLEALKILVDNGADPSDPGALIEAARNGYADVVDVLLKGREVEQSTRDEALKLAKQRHLQTRGAFGARESTPPNGHKRTLSVLQKCNVRGR